MEKIYHTINDDQLLANCFAQMQLQYIGEQHFSVTLKTRTFATKMIFVQLASFPMWHGEMSR